MTTLPPSQLQGAFLLSVFFRDCGVGAVLESSCIYTYTPVLRAALPSSREKIRLTRNAFDILLYSKVKKSPDRIEA